MEEVKNQITVYNDMSDSPQYNLKGCEGQTIQEVFGDVSLENAIILVNGREQERDYVLKENDCVLVRMMPSAPAVVAALAIASAVAAVGVGIYAGVKMYRQKKELAKMQDELENMKQKTNNDEITNSPFIAGSSNTIATGKTMPMMFGRNLFTPYLLNSRYYSIEKEDGLDEYVSEALELGFNPIHINKINIDDITVYTFPDDNYAQQGSYRFSGNFFSNNDQFEIVQNQGKNTFGGGFGNLNARINSNVVEKQIPYIKELKEGTKEELVFTLDEYAKGVEVCLDFPNGIYQSNPETGEYEATWASVWMEYSLNGGASWERECAEAFDIDETADDADVEIANALVDAGSILPYDTYTKVSDFSPSYQRKGSLYTSAYVSSDTEEGLGERHKDIETRFSDYIVEWDNPVATQNDFLAHSYRQNYRVYNIESVRGSYDSYNGHQCRRFDVKKTHECRYILRCNFNQEKINTLKNNGQKCIMIRLREFADKDASKCHQCYVKYYQSLCYDPKVYKKTGDIVECPSLEERERKMSAMMALKIKATAATEEKLKKINIIATGMARVCSSRWSNGNKVYTWSSEKVPTRNPASAILEILTSDKHNKSRFRDDEIDMDSLGELYDFCESGNRDSRGNVIPLYFDYVITSPATKEDALKKALEVCGATMYTNLYGKISFAIDKAKGNAVALFTSQNVKSIKNSKEFGRLTDCLRVKYINSENDAYQEDSALFFKNASYTELSDLPSPADAVIKEVTLTGITNYRQAGWYARRYLAMENLRPKKIEVNVGKEGMFFVPFSKVLMQTDSLKVGLGNGVIKSVIIENGKIKKLYVSNPINFQQGDMGLVVNHIVDEGAVPVSVAVGCEGGVNTNLVNVLTDLNEGALEAGDTFAWGRLENGKFTKITSPYLITAVRTSSSGTTLDLVDYNADVYLDADIPDYVPNISEKPRNVRGEIQYESIQDVKQYLSSLITTDSTPPTVPTGLAGATNELGEITLTWIASTDDSGVVAKYNIFRKASASASWELIASVDGRSQDLHYLDTSLNRNTQQYYCISAVDGRNNESEKCFAVPVLSVVSVQPNEPRQFRLKAEKDYIRFDWSYTPSDVAAYHPKSFVIGISKDNGATWEEIETSANSFYRYFDRSGDGYPEQDELDSWLYRVKSVSIYNMSSDWIDIGSKDFDRYRTWIVPDVSLRASATFARVLFAWDLDTNFFYEKLQFDVYLDGNLLASDLSAYSYLYAFTEYLERDDLEALPFTIKVKTGVYEKDVSVGTWDFSSYSTFKIAKPNIVAVAEKEGVRIEWKKNNDFYLDPTYELYKDGSLVFNSDRQTSYFYKFADGEYPEASDFADYSFQVEILTAADSSISDPAAIDASGYKTHIPETPTVYISSSSRNANLSWNEQHDCYDFVGCFIQIAKGYKAEDGVYTPITDESELEWYAPALGLNPYASLDNYKNGELGGYLEVKGTSVSFSLPLYGQDGDGARDTGYYFRLKAKTASGKTSGYSTPCYIEVKATSAYDVVKAWDIDPDTNEKIKLDGALGARQIFVEELAAITANLGFITDGAMRGDQYNYWAVNDTPMEGGGILYKGSFRVGGTDQYIEVKPRLNDGLPTGEYDIKFVVGAYEISASGTRIEGGAFEVYDNSGNLVFHTGADGNIAAVETGTYQDTKPASFEVFSSGDTPERLAVAGFSFGGEAYSVVYWQQEATLEIYRIDSDNEDFVLLNSVLLGNSDFSVRARGDGSGKVVVVDRGEYVSGGKYYQWRIRTYDTAGNAFSQPLPLNSSEIDYNEFFATDHGVLFLKDSAGSRYFGLDGTSLYLENKFGDLRDAYVLDTQDELYIIQQAVYGTILVKADKRAGTTKYNGFPFSGEIDRKTNTRPLFRPARSEWSSQYSPFIDGGFLYFHASGRWAQGVEVSEPCSGIVRIDLNSVVWYDYSADDIPEQSVIIPDFYELDYGTVPFNSGKEFDSDGDLSTTAVVFDARKDCWVCPLVDVVSADDFVLIKEYKFTADYGSPSTPRLGCRWHENAVAAEHVATIQDEFVYALQQAFFQSSVSLAAGGFKVSFVSNVEGSYTTKTIQYRVRVGAFFTEARENTTGLRAFRSGIGFEKVLFSEGSRRYKFCLNPGSLYWNEGPECAPFIEFDRYGNLIASGERGPQGERGEKGADGSEGKSAYQVWLDAGHEGTEDDFIEFIKGDKGDDGVSPSIAESEGNGADEYRLDITTADGSFTTPNLKGADGQDETARELIARLQQTVADAQAAINGKAAPADILPTLDTLGYINHNIPRAVPKDITAYYNDGTIYQRLAGTNGFSKCEDIFVGDYFKMSRPISAYERTGQYQATGSQYVTIAGISTLKRNGNSDVLNFEHLVMVPGQGFGGTQHFGRSRMNETNTTEGGYVSSEMNATTIGAVATSGSTVATATINQQLYAEFGSHLKTTRELVSTAINATGYNRFGSASGCSSNWAWGAYQAILMSEVEVYGSEVWSSSGFDTGNASRQLPLFFFSAEARNNRSAWYWLKGVASLAYCCYADYYGNSTYSSAGNAGGYVRPRFVIA